MTDDRFWDGIWWVPDGEGPGLRSATLGECCAEIVRLRNTIETWGDSQISTNDQIIAALDGVRDRINEQIIAEINDPRNTVDGPAFHVGMRMARIIVNRVIGFPPDSKGSE